MLHKNFCEQTVDPDQTPHVAASVVSLHNLHVSSKRVCGKHFKSETKTAKFTNYVDPGEPAH